MCVCLFVVCGDNWPTNRLPVMCPGKRSFWTSLAVSPFQGLSRGRRWLALFDFGKTSPLLSGNLTDSAVRGVLTEPGDGENPSKSAKQPQRRSRWHKATPPAKTLQRLQALPRIERRRLWWRGSGDRPGKRRRSRLTLTFLKEINKNKRTAPCASSSDTVTPHAATET